MMYDWLEANIGDQFYGDNGAWMMWRHSRIVTIRLARITYALLVIGLGQMSNESNTTPSTPWSACVVSLCCEMGAVA
jgi:hypothetical protein